MKIEAETLNNNILQLSLKRTTRRITMTLISVARLQREQGGLGDRMGNKGHLLFVYSLSLFCPVSKLAELDIIFSDIIDLFT